MRTELLLLLLLSSLAWGQPTPSPTVSPTAAVKGQEEEGKVPHHSGEGDFKPSAKDPNRVAMFDFMITARQHDQLGFSLDFIGRKTLIPVGLALLLLPLYLKVSRRGLSSQDRNP